MPTTSPNPTHPHSVLLADGHEVKLYVGYWLGLPDIWVSVAATTRGLAKRTLTDHAGDVFPCVAFVDIRMSRAPLVTEQAFRAGLLEPHLAHPSTSIRGRWQ